MTRRVRFAVSIMPRQGILDPQGRAVEQSMPHLGIDAVRDVRIGRRVELSVTVDASGAPASVADEHEARALIERLAQELLSNPLIEDWAIEAIDETSAPSEAPADQTGAPTGQSPPIPEPPAAPEVVR